MPIRKCIQSAINLSESDVDSVMSGYESYVKGMDSDAAALLAIDDVIVSAQSERSELLALINEQYPEAQVTEAPAQPMAADAESSLNPEEQSEYDQAVAKGLDMSEEARMKRARDMGFDTKNIYYHGTEAFEPFSSFRVSDRGTFGKGVYFTSSKNLANEMGEAGRVIKTYLKMENPYEFEVNDDLENKYDFDSPAVSLIHNLLGPSETKIMLDNNALDFGHFDDRLTKELIKRGYDGVIATFSDGDKEVVVLEPNQIRSTDAAFDPDYKDSADILARQDEVDEVPYESTIVKPQAIIRANERVETDQPVQPGDFVQHSPQPKTVSKNSIGIESLDKLARELRTNNPGLDNVKFNIFETQDEAFGPGSVAKNGVIKGGFNSGSNDLILIAENLRNTPDAMMVIRHEMVGHFGFRSLLNKDGAFDKLLGRIYKARTGEMKEQYDWVARNYPSLIANNEARTIADEMLARSAETETKSNFVKYIYDQIIKLLNQFKLTRGAVTQSEINSLVRSSATNLRKPIRTSRDSFQTNDGQTLMSREEQSEYDSALAKGLDMSQEARMKRAKDMGFDTETVFYHGTDADFDAFDTDFINPTLPRGMGFDFTTSTKRAGSFGRRDGQRVISAFLKFNNPYIFKPEDNRSFVKWKAEKFGKYGGDKFREWMKTNNYDALIHEGAANNAKHVVIFEPSNIRSVNAAFDPDFKDSGNLLASKALQLSALHNLSSENLINADKMGGLAVPSIGVVTADMGIEGYGDITMIGTKDLGDPDQVEVFDADAYTATFPAAEYRKAKVADADKLINEIRPYVEKYSRSASTINVTFDNAVNTPKPDEISSYWLRDNGIKAMYLEEVTGSKQRVITRDVSLSDSAAAHPAIQAFFKSLPDNYNNLGANSPIQEQARIDIVKPYKLALEEKYGDRKDYAGLVDMLMEKIDSEEGMSFGSFSRLLDDQARIGKTEISDLAIEEKLDKKLKGKEAAFQKWVTDKVMSIFGEPELTIGRKKEPYTLSNIVEYMTTGSINAAEKTMTFSPGKARAAAAKKFDGLNYMRNEAAYSLKPKSELKESREAADQLLSDYRDVAIEHYGEKNWRGEIDTWGGLDASMKAIAHWAKNRLKRGSKAAMKEGLRKNGFTYVPTSVINKGIEAGDAMLNAPVPYFESKPQRAVKLSEFAGAVVPNNVSKEVLDILDNNGIQYKKYGKKFDEEARTKAVVSLRKKLSQAGNDVLFRNDENQGETFFRVDDSIDDLPVGPNLGMPEEKLKEKFVRVAQDSFNRVKKMQSTLKEQGGNVTFDGDVYGAEERSSAKISNRLDRIDKDIMNPLLKFMDKNDVTLEQQDEFLIAMHATERNEYIASINDAMPDGGSGMTNQEAEEILNGYSPERRAVLEEAASFVYAVNRQHLSDLVEGGHLTQEVADGYSDRWDFYVPLKGKEGQEGRPGVGVGFGITGSGIRNAMGRGEGNTAESPTAHSFAQAQSAVVRTEKTKVGQALIQLIRDNPDPNFWTISQRTYKQFVDMFGEPFEGYDEAPAGLIENLDYKRVMNSEGKVVFRLNPNYKNRDDVFPVMVEGQELLVQIEDKVLMEQLKRMNITQLNIFVRGFGTVNRYLAMINTALNPEFVITNFERDFQTAMVNLGGEHSAAIAARVAKSIPSAIRGIAQSTFDMEGQSEWRALYEEMREEGGTIGFFGLEDIDTQVKKIQNRLVNRHGVLGRSKRGIASVRDFILDANLSVENAARLASYKVIKDESIANGLSEKEAKGRAASVAKNLTVNFNRKGEWAPVLNSTYLFYNASIQGSARIFTALENPRVRRIVGGIVAMSFALAMYNRSAGGDDDDGIPHWDKIGDYEKQTNLIFMNSDGSGRRTTIRLPYGYNVFSYAGSAMHDLMYNPRRSVAQTTSNILSATLNAFNPIQGADLADTITPTFLKPYMQDVRNMNFMGSPIKPENPFDNYDRPESQKSFKSTNPTLVDMMEAINAETGGDQTHSGLIDISPEIVNHYISWLTGGAGMTATRALSTATNLATGEPIDTRNIPFVRSFVKEPGSFFDTERFYTAIREVNAVEAQLKILKGTDEYNDYKSRNMEVHDLALHVNRYKNKISRLRDEQDKAYADEDTVLADEKREEMRQEMMEFSLKYDEAIMAQE
jgi:hypothetical protein